MWIRAIAGLLISAAVTAPAHSQTIKIGAPLALTGGLADEGKKQAAAYDLWLARVNAAGGIMVGGKKMRVELVTYDYQTDGKRAQQLAEKLITDDKVDFMTAPFGSGHAVTGIQGKQTYRVTVTGEEAHAGTKPMHERRDALISALGMVKAMHDLCRERDARTLFTVGRFQVEPNAPSVVPARATFSIDLRHFETAVMRELGAAFAEICRANAGPCEVKIENLVDAPSLIFPEMLRCRTLAWVDALGHAAMELPSAAGHDARHLSDVAPSAMVFVPCRGGISHHESEWAESAHLFAGAQVLAGLVWEAAEAYPANPRNQ